MAYWLSVSPAGFRRKTVINVISDFADDPMVLWDLTGNTENGRLVTTADQADTTALRDPTSATYRTKR